MPKHGLLQKAKFLNDKAAGISPDDRREILEQIEKITRTNRIGGRKIPFTARKHGAVFPIAVNLAAIAVTAAGLWILSVSFQAREAEAVASGAALSSAEGKLIQELKRDSESRLSEKDKEIEEMQSRIAAIEADRTKLQANFETRLADRETELRAQLQEELRVERERLLAQGLAESVIQERLKKFEEERTAAFRRQLAEFQQRLDEERAAADANYAKLRDEYRSGMVSLNEERKRIQDEARQREDELRTSLEARTQELETERAQATAGLEQARVELARAEEARKAQIAAEERIVGLYLAFRSAIQERRFEEAAARAAALKAYLEDPSLTSIAATQVRRPADMFAAEALAFMARTELERAGLDNTLLLRQAELVSAVRSAAAKARASGNTADRLAAYREALGAIPEVLEAHEYFTERSSEEAASRRSAAVAAIAAAGTALDRGEYAEAAASFREAALRLADDPSIVDSLDAGLRRLATAEYLRDRSAADSRAAQAPLAAAYQDIASRRWEAAIRGFSSILANAPAARQTPEAVRGIEEAFAGLAADARVEAEAAGKRIAELEADAARLTEALRAAEEADAAKTAQLTAEHEARLLELQGLLEEARRETAAAVDRAATEAANAATLAAQQAAAQQAAAQTAESSGTDPAAELRALQALREENARLTQAAARYDALVARYASFSAAEESARSTSGAASLVEARLRFNEFLDDPDIRFGLPDLKSRIERFEREFAAEKQSENFSNAIDIAENALRLRDQPSRERYFSDLADRFKDEPDMMAYIETLKRGLR